MVNVKFPCFRFSIILPGGVWSVTKGVASAWPSGSTGSCLWESNEEDALGSIGRELLDLPAISAIDYVKVIDFLTATARSSFLPERYTRALWLANFGATFKLDKVAGATIQSSNGAGTDAIQSDAPYDCLVRILASHTSKKSEGLGNQFAS